MRRRRPAVVRVTRSMAPMSSTSPVNMSTSSGSVHGHEILADRATADDAPSRRVGERMRRGVREGASGTWPKHDGRLKDNHPVHQGVREKSSRELGTAFDEDRSNLETSQRAQRTVE